MKSVRRRRSAKKRKKHVMRSNLSLKQKDHTARFDDFFPAPAQKRVAAWTTTFPVAHLLWCGPPSSCGGVCGKEKYEQRSAHTSLAASRTS